ncbi:hypothetical protein [Sphingobium baderi]|uniref:hypothetical protein n=1 Tax=Sphingobium baderi TaxID=1332080 RepID=UPI00119E7299|nr:hypothetical protein [Sphingobium baderi]
MKGSSKQRVLIELKAALNTPFEGHQKALPKDFGITIKFGLKPMAKMTGTLRQPRPCTSCRHPLWRGGDGFVPPLKFENNLLNPSRYFLILFRRVPIPGPAGHRGRRLSIPGASHAQIASVGGFGDENQF